MHVSVFGKSFSTAKACVIFSRLNDTGLGLGRALIYFQSSAESCMAANINGCFIDTGVCC